MRICILSIPNRHDNPRLGLVGPGDVVLDANEAHATALAGHMEAKRAYEIADALVPSDLYGFVRNGRHSWRALGLALELLGPAAADLDLRSPRGERVALRRWEVDVRPLLDRARDVVDLDTSRNGMLRTPIGYGDSDGGDRVTRASYAFGGVDDVEYAALVATPGEHVTDLEAWDHLAGYMRLTAATRWQALYLHSADELHPVDDADVYCELAEAVSTVSREHGLAAGDIVRTGTRRSAPMVDLTADLTGDLTAGLGAFVGDTVLERLLTRADS